MIERLDISTRHCTIERDGRVVIFTMNRPEKKNALSPDMLAGLVLGYEYVDDEPEVRCAVLTGAGGSEILQGTDIRVAGESAIFGVWEAKRGLFPLGGSACRLPRQIPYTLAMDILLRCPPVPAPVALEIGLIGHVVPDGEALTRARELAAEVAEMGPLSTKAILRAWRETEHMNDADAMQHQDKIGWEVFASEDAQEGPKAFGEKRAPVFRGK